jgi:purine-binding chemotaxis protein CheW
MVREPTSPVEAVARADSAAPWAFFACTGRGYAIRLEQIHEIVPPQPLTRLPGCGPAVCGLVGLRGRLITVFDLGILTGGQPAAAREDYRVLLVRRGERVVGMAVDELVTIGALGEAVQPVTIQGGADHGRDALDVGGRTFIILEPDRIIGPLLA